MRLICSFLAVLFLASCTTSTEGRWQIMAVSEERVEKTAARKFERAKKRYKTIDRAVEVEYVNCVVASITQQIEASQNWEVVLFDSSEPNAFALSGGKIGIHSALLYAAVTPDQLAFVVGHEIGHVIAQHGRERMSQQLAVDSLNLLAREAEAQSLATVLQLGVLYPYSQVHESEADRIGLRLMAKAGYNPEEAIFFWNNLESLGIYSPSGLFSTHSKVSSRIQSLEEMLPELRSLQKNTEKPKCDRS